MLQRWLPAPNRNIAIYYYLSSSHAAAFVNGNWLFFWMRLMTFSELGLIDALSFAFGLLMEVPTGAAADLLGKKRSMIVAHFCLGIGFVVMAAADVVWVLIAGFWLSQIGWAFYSGASEALAYDSLKERGQESMFDRVVAADMTLGNTVFVVCVLIGGVMYRIDERMPHYAWGIVFLIGAVLSFWLREPKVEKMPFSFSVYARQLGQGFRQLWVPSLRAYLPLIFAASGAYFIYSFGLVQPTMALNFGFDADAQAVVTALLGIITALAAFIIPPLRRRLSSVSGLILFSVVLAVGFFGGLFPLGIWGFGALMLLRVGGSLVRSWSSILINEAIPSEARATTLSSLALLTRIPYAVTAVLAGAMAEAGTFPLFTLGVAVFVLLGVFITGAASLNRAPRPAAAGQI